MKRSKKTQRTRRKKVDGARNHTEEAVLEKIDADIVNGSVNLEPVSEKLLNKIKSLVGDLPDVDLDRDIEGDVDL